MAPTTAQSQPQPTAGGGFLSGLQGLISNLVQNATSKMGGGPPGPSAPSSGIPNLPTNMQAGNSKSPFMDWLSGILGGGNPLKDQNNAYVMGQVKQQQAYQTAAHAKAQADGIAAQNRSLKKSMKAIPPVQQAQPGTGVTAPSAIQQMVQNIPQGQ